MVWDHHPAGHPERQLLERQGADRQDRAARSGLQQDQGPVQLGRGGCLNPGEAPATLLANLRVSTLGVVCHQVDACNISELVVSTLPDGGP